MASLIVKLPDGSPLTVDEHEWHVLASATDTCLRHDGIKSSRLVVRTASDNQVLIYAEIDNGTAVVRSGKLLSAESPNILATLQQVAVLYSLPIYCFESCLEQLYRKESPPGEREA